VTGSIRYNGQIPTDPTTVVLILASCTALASQLSPEQAQAITAAGGLAEFAQLLIRLLPGRR
jgi:hypothetical protein